METVRHSNDRAPTRAHIDGNRTKCQVCHYINFLQATRSAHLHACASSRRKRKLRCDVARALHHSMMCMQAQQLGPALRTCIQHAFMDMILPACAGNTGGMCTAAPISVRAMSRTRVHARHTVLSFHGRGARTEDSLSWFATILSRYPSLDCPCTCGRSIVGDTT